VGQFRKNRPSGAKAFSHSAQSTARLKPCPFKARAAGFKLTDYH